MTGVRRDTKWWGWGDAEKRQPLSGSARAMLAELGAGETERPAPALEEVELSAATELPATVVEAAGAGNVLTGAEDRVRHATGSSYPDLIRRRSGRLETPDAVVVTEDETAVRAVLEACTRERIAVVPFGGGTSVVGGVDPIRGEHGAVIALDLAPLRAVEVDRSSLLARLGAGLRGPEAEDALAPHGLTLGHFPQSFEYATIGGFAATRSAGQASSGYGRFDDLVASARMIAPAGDLETLRTSHTAAGPSLLQVALGSEGALGVITEVTARVRPAPEARRYEAWMAADFESACELVRALAQDGALPDVIRLSDREETRVSLAMAGTGGAGRRAFDLYLRARRRSEGCLIIAGYEGSSEAVSRRRALGARGFRFGGAAYLGRKPGAAWRHGRYDGPYLRDELLDAGLMAETLETSHVWSALDGHYRAVGDAIRGALEDQGTPGIVMCHLSHAYRDGASLYYTFIAPQRAGNELEQWRAVKTAACEAIVAQRGTITHHHAVGRDHAPYMGSEVGELGVELLRTLKEGADPAGIMNPGKLVPG